MSAGLQNVPELSSCSNSRGGNSNQLDLQGGGIYGSSSTILLVQATFAGNTPDPYDGSKFTVQCHPGSFHNLQSSSCDACPAGAYSNDPNAVSCLTADFASFVRNNTAVTCPAKLNNGATCGHGQLAFLNGSWHDGLNLSSPSVDETHGLTTYSHRQDFLLDEMTRFYSCPGGNSTCTADRNTGSVTCATGTAGVLCAVCADGYTRLGGGACTRCDSTAHTVSFALGLLVAAAVLLAGVAVKFANASTNDRVVRLTTLVKAASSKLYAIRTKLKLTFVFYQVVLLLGSVFDIPFERLPGFHAFCEALSVFKFDFDFLHIGCISFSYSFHTKLYSISAVALVLEAGVVGSMSLFWLMPSCTQSAKVLVTKLASWMLLGTYFLYPSVCATIFTPFNCDTIDTTTYLIADYSIDCDSTEHAAAKNFAYFMIVAFAVGLPALYMCLLMTARQTSTTEDSKMLDFFHADYKDEYFYWSVCAPLFHLCVPGHSHISRFVLLREVVECGRKLLLTGFSVFFGVGSIMQAVLGILVTLVYVLTIAWLHPYDTTNGPTNNQLAVADHAALLVVLQQVVMIKFRIVAEAVDTPAFEPGYDAQLVNTVLVLTLAFTGLLGGLLMLNDLRRDKSNTDGVQVNGNRDDPATVAATDDSSITSARQASMAQATALAKPNMRAVV
jgi:hypothetical protein